MGIQSQRFLMITALLGLVVIPSLPVVAVKQDTPPKPAEAQQAAPEPDGPASVELRNLAKADQADRAWSLLGRPPTEAELSHMVAEDAKRLVRVRELVQQDKIVTAEDFDRAALLFQHGDTPEDILVAHELSFIALLKKKGRGLGNLPVLAEDRFLERIGYRQRFGSQGRSFVQGKESNTDQSSINDVDEKGPFVVTDMLRADLFMPPLAASWKKGPQALSDYIDPIIERAKQRNDRKWQKEEAKRPASKELERMGREIVAAKVSDNARVRAVENVRKLYKADELHTPDDYYHASIVLLLATDGMAKTDSKTLTNRFLLAHELAMVAALRRHPKAPQLFAHTWDAFLIAAGKPQRYGTQQPESGNKAGDPGNSSASASNAVKRALGVGTSK